MRSIFLRMIWALLVLSIAMPERAAAQDDVHDLLASAVAEYDGQNYEEAYALFVRVHELQPSARSERALGKATFELRRYRECVQWLEASLADQRSPLTDEMRTEVSSLLARARAFVGRFTLHTNVADAIVEVDGAPASDATIQLDLGEHEIVVRADGYQPSTRRVAVHGGEDEVVELTLVRAAPTTGVASEDPGAMYRDFGWASLITGVALAIGGAVATGIWASAVGTLNANIDSTACTVDPGTDNVLPGNPPTCFDLQNRYRLALPFAYVGFIAGGALLATGLGLILGAPGAATAQRAGDVRCSSFADVGVLCRVAF